MSTLEFPLLRAPLESLSQITRNTQKIIAKEITTCTNGVNHFTNAVKVGTTKDNTVAMSTALTTLIGNVQQLKRKLEEASTQSTKHARRCSSRLTYLHELDDTEHTYHEHHRHYQKHQSQQSQQQSQQWISIAQQIVAMQNATGMGAIPMGMNITTSPNVTPIAMPVSPTFSSSSFLSPSLSPTLSPTISSPIPSLSLSPPLSHLPSEQTYLQHIDTRKQMHHKRLHKIFIDYLGRNGYLSSATMLTEQTGLHDLVDLDLFLSARRVLDGLAKKDVTRGLAWCGENRSRLVKINSTLEFDLRIQDFLHLIRTCSTIDAITYAQKHLSPHATTSIQHMQKIGEVMNAFVYRDVILNDDGDVNEAWKKYKPLFDDSRWTTLANAFRTDHLTLAGLPRTSALEMMLSSGISALKTPWCNDTSASHDSGDCPICCAPLAALARTLPMSQRTHSCLVCRLSGEVMDEHNPPLVLPNGSIYSKQALTRQAIASGGHVTCPRTGQSFPLAQCRQAYVL